ncbi:MAG: cupin domain-containing protein [Firmicutes bacterium]|nr:cupin domain-containing protein [Bacillota bacterium]
MKVINPQEASPYTPELHFNMHLREVVGKTLGSFTAAIGYMEPGGGAEAHKHDGEHLIFVLEGKLSVTGSDGTVQVPAGQAVYIGVGELHATKNEESERAVYLIITVPSRGK